MKYEEIEKDAETEELGEEEAVGEAIGSCGAALHNMRAGSTSDRKVLLQDAVEWLNESDEPFEGSIFTGLPDMLDLHQGSGADKTCSKSRRKEVGELQLADEYEAWFRACALRLLTRLAPGQCAVFSQTDTRVVQEDDGRVVAWLDKSHLLSCSAAEVPGVRLLWHKIAVDSSSASSGGDGSSGGHSHRPCYTHVLCFGKHFSYKVSAFITPDIINRGEMTWLKATGLEVCLLGVLFLKHVVGAPRLLNPFCGHGTILAVANYFGLPALGVEVLPKRWRRSRSLTLGALLDRVPLSSLLRLGLPASCALPLSAGTTAGEEEKQEEGKDSTAASADANIS